MPNPRGFKYDAFVSFPWQDPEGKWVAKLFAKRFAERLKHAVPTWDPEVFVKNSEGQIGNELDSELSGALRSTCVLVPVLCYPYFRRPWCAAEYRTFRAPGLDPTGAAGRPRHIAPVIYSGDPNIYPLAARGLLYSSFSKFSNRTQIATQAFFDNMDQLVAKVASLLIAEAAPPDPKWPVFTASAMETLITKEPAKAADWMLISTPIIDKPTFSVAA